MNTCVGLITESIVPNCSAPLTKGFERRGVIINWDDIDWSLLKWSTPCSIKELVLIEGAQAYEIVQLGNTPFSGSTSEVVVGTLSNSVTKNVSFTILSKGLTEALNLKTLINGKFVVILENTYKAFNTDEQWVEAGEESVKDGAGAPAFEVFGINQGLFVTAASKDPYSSDTQGGWQVTMTETEAPIPEVYFFDGSYETTAMKVMSLLISPE